MRKEGWEGSSVWSTCLACCKVLGCRALGSTLAPHTKREREKDLNRQFSKTGKHMASKHSTEKMLNTISYYANQNHTEVTHTQVHTHTVIIKKSNNNKLR